MSDRKARIIDLWNAGKSTGQIAAEHGLSNGTVCGMLYRARKAGENVRGRKPVEGVGTGGTKLRGGKVSMTRVRQLSKPAALPPVVTASSLPSVAGRLMELTARECRWIDGDPRHGGTFCGQPTDVGKSWCEHHHGRVYVSRTEGKA